jgi:hypothetical protein
VQRLVHVVPLRRLTGVSLQLSVVPQIGVSRNEPFGSRPEPWISLFRSIHQPPHGEVPEGRAELGLSPGVYALQRTLEPVLEPGVTKKDPHPWLGRLTHQWPKLVTDVEETGCNGYWRPSSPPPTGPYPQIRCLNTEMVG